MIHSNYPPGAENDPRSPWNQEEEENTRTPEELLEELLESLEDLTDPDGQEFTCSTCTHIYNLCQEAREELNKIY